MDSDGGVRNMRHLIKMFEARVALEDHDDNVPDTTESTDENIDFEGESSDPKAQSIGTNFELNKLIKFVVLVSQIHTLEMFQKF